MPELPEVETVARDLRAAVVGRQVMAVQLGHPKVLRFPVPEVFAAVLPGQRIRGGGPARQVHHVRAAQR